MPTLARKLLAAAALAAAPLLAHEAKVRVQDLPPCGNDPFAIWVVNGTDENDCDRTAGGLGFDRHGCWCLSGTYVAMPDGAGSGDPLIVAEGDGTPEVDPTTRLEFEESSFVVTDEGGGTASVDINPAAAGFFAFGEIDVGAGPPNIEADAFHDSLIVAGDNPITVSDNGGAPASDTLVIGLNQVDGPNDEECATWEDTGLGIEWEPCGGGSALVVEEADESPSVDPTSVLQFDQADGFTVTDETGGQVQVDLVLAGDVDGSGGATDLDEAAVETELEGVLDLDQLQGQIADGQIAAGAVDGGAGGEIQDGTVSADDLGADSVSSSELDGAGVETELEGLLDLPDLQGVLDVPSGGTGAAPGGDDQVLVSDSSSAATWRTVPDSDGATQKLQYDQATNAFSAGTDDDVPEAGDFGALALTGDVTSSGLTTTIGADAVGDAELDFIDGDTPADEDCITIETGGANGTLEAQPCGGGSSLTVEEADGSPSVSPVDTIEFDQADGFTVTDETGGDIQVDLVLVGGAGVTVSGATIALDTSEASSIASGTAAPTNDAALVIDTNGSSLAVTTDVLIFQQGSEDFILFPVREYPGASGQVIASNTTNGDVEWVDHGGLGGLADDDHSQYALLAGRTNQDLYGGTSSTGDLNLRANSASTSDPAVLIDGTSFLQLLSSESGARGFNLVDTGSNVQGNFHFGTGGSSYMAFHPTATGSTSSEVARVEDDGVIGTDIGFRAGQSDSDANSSCISVTSDVLYGDRDCDRTKDATEVNVDEWGYTMQGAALNAATLTDAQTIFFGASLAAPTTTDGANRIFIPREGTIRVARAYARCGTAGTNESWTMTLRINSSTNVTIQALSDNTANRVWSVTGLSTGVAAGDYVEFRSVNPTWATNPANCLFSGSFYVSIP